MNQIVASSTYSSSMLPWTMWFRVRVHDSAGNPGNESAVRTFEVKD